MPIIIPIDSLLQDLFPEAARHRSDPATMKGEIEEFYSGYVDGAKVRIEADAALIDVTTASVENFRGKYDQVASLAQKGDYKRAKAEIEDLLEKYRTASDLHRMYGQALYEEGDPKAAKDFFIDALRWDPENVEALVMMGNWYLTTKDDFERAQKYYDLAIAAAPDNYLVLNNLGGMMLNMERLDESERYFNLALESNSEYPNTHYGLALLLRRKDELLDAFHHAIKAVELGEGNTQIADRARDLALDIATEYDKSFNADDLIKTYSEQLEKESGKSIEVKSSPDIQTQAKLEVAESHARDKHVVLFKEAEPFVGHLILHEMVHLDLIVQARKEQNNMLFTTTDERKQKFLDDQSAHVRRLKRKGLPEEQVVGFVDSLFNGLNLQMYNAPIDLFIEQYLYDVYSELRPIQFASLYRMQTGNAESSQSQEIRKLTPKRVFEANVTLNLVHAYQLKDLYGVDLVRDFSMTPRIKRQADKLYEEYLEIKDDRRAAEEYELVNDWAEDLKVSDYFSLIDEASALDTKQEKDTLGSIEADPLNWDTPERESDGNRVSMRESPTGSMAVTMYLVDAIQMFDGRDEEFVRAVTFEVAMLGNYGLNPSESEQKYSLKSVPDKKFSALHLLAIMYAGFRILDSTVDTELDFEEEYEMAKKLV